MTGPASSEASDRGEPCLRASGVNKVYRSPSGDVSALEDVNLEVYDREFFCLVGPSGCGKSTFLRLLGGLLESDSGEIEILKPESDDRPTTSMVFQEYGIFPWKSVIENVAFGLKMRGVGTVRRREIARRYIEKVNLSEFEEAYPHQLSGGMKQRVSIARAFANDPEIFLMDEPFGALDAQTKQYLLEELLSLWSESRKTVVYVTHDIEEAIRVGDRIGVMSARPGRIKTVVDVDLDRPRTREAVPTARFEELQETVWGSLSDEVERSVERSVRRTP
ncbi:MAG: ABC transporter ATP-binding protein [Haloferacaceae archaeon]